MKSAFVTRAFLQLHALATRVSGFPFSRAWHWFLNSHCQRLARLARLARFLNFSPFAEVTHFFASRTEYTLTRAWNQLIVFLFRSFPVIFVIFRDFDVDPFLSQADQHSWLPENCNWLAVNVPNLHPRIRSMNICPFVSFLVAIGDPPNVILATNPDLCKVSYNSTEMFGFFNPGFWFVLYPFDLCS